MVSHSKRNLLKSQLTHTHTHKYNSIWVRGQRKTTSSSLQHSRFIWKLTRFPSNKQTNKQKNIFIILMADSQAKPTIMPHRQENMLSIMARKVNLFMELISIKFRESKGQTSHGKLGLKSGEIYHKVINN